MKLPNSADVSRVVARGAQSSLRGGIDQLVRRNLRGVWLRGDLPTGPCVWAANHHSWWDFFVAAAALRANGRRDVAVMMEAGNIGRQELFQHVVVGTDQVRSAVSLVARGSVLVIFPEGELRPPGPLGPVRPGAGWLAGRAGGELRTVATRVVLRGQQAAEAYLDVSEPHPSSVDLAAALGSQLTGLDAALAGADPDQPLPGYRRQVPGVRSWNERFAALRGSG